MKRYYMAYCSYCSVEATDERVLKEYRNNDGKKIIECTHCGGQSELVPAYGGAIFMKQKRLDNVKKRY